MITARILSLVGHPALLMPVTYIFSSSANGAPTRVITLIAVGSLLVGVATLAYSWWQVRAGRWSHIDASNPQERRQINLFLMLLFSGVACLMLVLEQPRTLIMWPAFSAALVAFGHLLRARLKMSLHVSFAVFAALLLWPSPIGTSALLVVAMGIAWSRLALSRHTLREVVVALLAGAATGVAFNLVSS